MDNHGDLIGEFTLALLPKHLHLFNFITGHQTKEIRAEDPINLKAAEKMARLHDLLKESGYDGKKLEVYLVRLLFILFAEDTGIFEQGLFLDLLLEYTKEDGSSLGGDMATLFQTLDEKVAQRQKLLPDHFNAFPYINGNLFKEVLPQAAFSSELREMLIQASRLDWSLISPAIFGSLFQGVMEPEERREKGAHYTAEANIFKLIGPLFLDDLKAELEAIKLLKRGRKAKLEEFHLKLANLRFLDPACGCGNFLVIAYRELRMLELEGLIAEGETGQLGIEINHLIKVNVDQFYGIEIDEFPAQIAQVALWLTDHQMNQKVSAVFGYNYARLPLTTAPTILHGNALELDWREVIKPKDLDYILGNPPFVGKHNQSKSQSLELKSIFKKVNAAGNLDYVSAWYRKAAEYIQDTQIEVAFVSTNSITQGEQVGVLWGDLLDNWGIKINFAHRTFSWTSEARGKAAVHCVIVGFARFDRPVKRLFDYEVFKGDAHEIKVENINPYLVNGPSIVCLSRSSPMCEAPILAAGNKPVDGGNYLFLEEEMNEFVNQEPQAKEFFRPWMGAKEFIQDKKRWVLYLGEVSSAQLHKMPLVLKRVKKVQELRRASKKVPTQKLAQFPTQFECTLIPKKPYLLIPKVSSERRRFVPIGFIQPQIISSDLVFISKKAEIFHFGVLSSTMHMAWMRYTAGRLKSDYRYSVGIVYNNFPWPEAPTDKQKVAIEKAAQAVLDARQAHPHSSLADLYDPLTMPQNLTKAHHALDKAVDAAYSKTKFATELERVQYLFQLYAKYTKPKNQT